MVQLIDASDYATNPVQVNSAIQSLGDTLRMKYLANLQNEQHGSEMQERAMTREDNTALRQGEQDEAANARVARNELAASAQAETKDARVAGNKISARANEIAALVQQAEQTLSDAQARGYDANTATTNDALARSRSDYLITLRAQNQNEAIENASEYMMYVESNHGGDISAAEATPEGRAVFNNIATRLFTDKSMGQYAASIGSHTGDQPPNLSIVTGKDGMRLAITDKDGKRVPVDDTVYSRGELIQLVMAKANGAAARKIAGLNGQEALITLAQQTTMGERAGGNRDEEFTEEELKRRIALGAMSTESDAANKRGGDDPEGERVRAAFGKTRATATAAAAASEEKRKQTNVRTQTLDDTQSDAHIASAIDSLYPRLIQAGSDAGTAGGLVDNDFEAMSTQGSNDPVESKQLMTTHYRTVLANNGGMVSRLMGYPTNSGEWTAAQHRKAMEVVLETTRGISRANNGISSFFGNNDLSREEAIPMPTLRQLQTAKNKLEGVTQTP